MIIYTKFNMELSWRMYLLIYCINNNIYLDKIMINESQKIPDFAIKSLTKIGNKFTIVNGSQYIYKNNKKYYFMDCISIGELTKLYTKYKLKINHSL